MNTVSARKYLTSMSLIISLLVLMSIDLYGGKGEEERRDTQKQAAVEQNDLIGADGKIRLRILLTTSPKEGRTADFVSFLSKHFVKVETADYNSFRREQAEDVDVVIIDYGMTRPGTPTPELTTEYSRATVAVGVAGSTVCRRLHLKPDYL